MWRIEKTNHALLGARNTFVFISDSWHSLLGALEILHHNFIFSGIISYALTATRIGVVLPPDASSYVVDIPDYATSVVTTVYVSVTYSLRARRRHYITHAGRARTLVSSFPNLA